VRHPPIHELLRRAAELNPDGTAVIDGHRTITYAELDARSDRLANAMAAEGVTRGDRVGLLLEKSIEAIVGIYAVLKSGGAYVPLDEGQPLARLSYIARNAGIHALVSEPSRLAACESLAEAGVPLRTVFGADAPSRKDGFRAVGWEQVLAMPARAPDVAVDADTLAYILYTSGSTGEPKGVMLSHENGVSFVDWAAREVGLGTEDRLSSHAPLHFDLSIFDLFAAARAAAPVALVPASARVFPTELADFIRTSGITVWYSVPSALTMLTLRGGIETSPLKTLRVVIFAGEVFPTKYLRQLIKLVPQARYFNFFGPTETNVCTSFEVPTTSTLADTIPIGTPLPCVTATIVRDGGELAADGEVGELMIGGATVMHGYWGDPERTARTLVHDPGRRVYRTGDLVRRLPDGTLHYLGRRDAQIKTRGYRVELGEVETALLALDEVVEAAVIAIPDDAVTNRLAAFVVVRPQLEEGALKRRLAERLPHYMIPDTVEFRDELPKSSTGKVDRRSLSKNGV